MSVGITYSPRLSVVVPVYNSEETLIEFVSRLEKVLRRLPTRFEAVLVNDGSQDHSWDVIRSLARKHDWIRGIDLMRNFGQHNALLCGIRAARFDVIVIMDDDLQHPPEEIPKLLEKLAGGYDVVYAAPQREQRGFGRNLAARMTKLALQNIMGAETARNVNAFLAFHTKVRDAFANYQSPYVSIDVLLTWGTTRFGVVPVRYDSRPVGRSNYTFRKLITYALNMMTGFSIFPLQAASLLGFAFTLLGLALLVYVLGNYLIYGSTVPGFSFLASIISIFSGAQLFALGIIGEYLARVHVRVMERPAYVVRSWSESEVITDELGRNRLAR